MERWVELCPLTTAPAEGSVVEAEAEGVVVCLARIQGTLHAMDNFCPHRQGPLSEGWIEGTAVVCPWHSWAFDVSTGETLPPEHGKVRVYPVRVEEGLVRIRLD